MDPELASLLSKLEPALGISFALNLAYIGLPRFRYRETIRDHVRKKMEDMTGIPEQHCGTDWYKQIVRLGALENNDGDEGNNKNTEKMPSEIWAKFYVGIFEKHYDRISAESVAFVCALLLFVGVAHEFNYLEHSRFLFTKDYIHFWFWGVVVFAALPVSLVVVGRKVVKGAIDFVNNNIKNLRKTFQKEAQQATIDVPSVTRSPHHEPAIAAQ